MCGPCLDPEELLGRPSISVRDKGRYHVLSARVLGSSRRTRPFGGNGKGGQGLDYPFDIVLRKRERPLMKRPWPARYTAAQEAANRNDASQFRAMTGNEAATWHIALRVVA